MKIYYLILFSLLFYFTSYSVNLKTDLDSLPANPKVGLVMSGGGAKGLAHIGLLQILDSLNIKIDYIGGSSMGSIIGGLYASGYSGNQLANLFSKFDFFSLLNNSINRRAKSLFEKKKGSKYIITLPFQNFEISLPDGISDGQGLLQKLIELTTHVHDVEDFSKLPIPFLAIGTNMETGEEIVMENGFLPLSILASGSLPTMISPKKINDKLITDGGVVNNFPVGHVKEKGMDIIIGSNVQKYLMPKEELKSLSSILQQLTTFKSKSKIIRQENLTDIYIRPNVENIDITDFNKFDKIIKIGKKEAYKVIDQLIELSERQKVKNKRKELEIKSEKFVLSSIDIVGNKSISKEYILAILGLKPPEVIDDKILKKSIDNLYSTNRFSIIAYKLKKSGQSKKLIVEVDENMNKSFFRLGFHYDNTFNTGVLFNNTLRNVLLNNSVLSSDIILGDKFRYEIKYEVDNGHKLGFGIKNSFINLPYKKIENFGSDTLNLNVNFKEFDTDFFLQTILGRKFSFSIGLEHKNLNIYTNNLLLSGKPFRIQKANFLSIYSNLFWDSFDDYDFPTKGIKFSGELKYLFFSDSKISDFEETSVTILHGEYVFPILLNFSIKLGTTFGTAIGNKLPKGFTFGLGGFFKQSVTNSENFFGYLPREIEGDQMIKSDLTLQYNFFKYHYLSTFGQIANVTKSIEDLLFSNIPYQSFGIGYGMKTIIGPINLIYAYSPSKKSSEIYVSLGHWF